MPSFILEPKQILSARQGKRIFSHLVWDALTAHAGLVPIAVRVSRRGTDARFLRRDVEASIERLKSLNAPVVASNTGEGQPDAN